MFPANSSSIAISYIGAGIYEEVLFRGILCTLLYAGGRSLKIPMMASLIFFHDRFEPSVFGRTLHWACSRPIFALQLSVSCVCRDVLRGIVLLSRIGHRHRCAYCLRLAGRLATTGNDGELSRLLATFFFSRIRHTFCF